MAYLSEPFRASEIVGWFRRHHSKVQEQSLRAHIQVATSNASVQSRGMFAKRRPLITRIEHGLYRRYDGDPEPIHPQSDRQASTVTVQGDDANGARAARGSSGLAAAPRSAVVRAPGGRSSRCEAPP